MKVNICGVPHAVKECEDKFDVDLHFGQIDHKKCEILVNKDLFECVLYAECGEEDDD